MTRAFDVDGTSQVCVRALWQEQPVATRGADRMTLLEDALKEKEWYNQTGADARHTSPANVPRPRRCTSTPLFVVVVTATVQ